MLGKGSRTSVAKEVCCDATTMELKGEAALTIYPDTSTVMVKKFYTSVTGRHEG